MKPKKYNNLRIGLILGILAPLLGFYIVYLAGFGGLDFGDFLARLMETRKLSAIISLSVIPNLLLFFIFIWLDYLYSARGVLASTLLFALVVIVTKFMI